MCVNGHNHDTDTFRACYMPEEDVVEDLQMRLFWEEALFCGEAPSVSCPTRTVQFIRKRFANSIILQLLRLPLTHRYSTGVHFEFHPTSQATIVLAAASAVPMMLLRLPLPPPPLRSFQPQKPGCQTWPSPTLGSPALRGPGALQVSG